MDSTDNPPYRSKSTWLRGLMMIVFAVCLGIAKFVMGAVVIFQFLHLLILGRTNTNLLEFGGQLSRYQYQIMLFLTFNSDEQPFPVADWPS